MARWQRESKIARDDGAAVLRRQSPQLLVRGSAMGRPRDIEHVMPGVEQYLGHAARQVFVYEEAQGRSPKPRDRPRS